MNVKGSCMAMNILSNTLTLITLFY